ncbi:hypothetical protein HYFRA_00012701 [Hymenoscyphus fraxineus]|uniref:Extracellular serine-rich protein n=1 Tax=Hymenoscyphus fraxineus TaxID=746836 RepID=A0A9N9L5Q9_9HELO|nr:hypothetical protein HYFRA_00012701 [Hymenoscyphus fraxineus]
MLRTVFTILSVALVGSKAVNAAEAPSTTSSAPAATHTVSVGAQGFNFSPNQLNASVGDIIEYRFYPQNHSVSRAGFGNQPCIPYELSGPGRVGFWSGFKPTQVVSNDLPLFRLRVNDTDPFFFYCSSPDACLQGMIGVVNPNATWSYEAQFGFTQKAVIYLSPGETFPEEKAASSTVLRTTTATGASTTPTSAPAATSSAPAVVPAEHSHGLSTGAIVGIVIGGVAVLVLGAAVAWMCGRQRTVKEIMRQSQQPPSHNPNNHNSYQASMAEANYSNMQKLPLSGQNSPGYVYGTPMMDQHSYRSASPPIDERTQMMGMERAIHPSHYQGGHQSNNSLPNTPGFPSPAYTHEMENSGMSPAAVGMRPYNPSEIRPPTSSGLHEMAVPSPTTPQRAPSTGNPPTRVADESRPFSYTDSESGYRSDKNDTSLH